MMTRKCTMGKIHPAASKSGSDKSIMEASNRALSVWTVWKKSSMAFQGTDGFSVYDGEGKLAFRVDNYSRRHKELVLMDGAGNGLIALRPQILSLHDQWNGFGEDDSTSKVRSKSQIFSMRRHSFLHKSNVVDVFMRSGTNNDDLPDFQIEARSFWRRTCKIWNKSGHVVAEISRKVVSKSVVLSDDVFSLIIQPGVDRNLIMAFVVVMDRICQKPAYGPIMCSYQS